MALENIDKMPQGTFDEIVEKYGDEHCPSVQGRGTGAAHAFDLTRC